MKRISQLARLILNFYREDPQQLQELEPLRACQVYRRWGILYVRCHDQKQTAALAEACVVIAEPIAKLRLAKKITFLTKNTPIAEYFLDAKKIGLEGRMGSGS